MGFIKSFITVSICSLEVYSLSLQQHDSYYPPKPSGVTTIPTKRPSGVSLTYKPVKGVCETTPNVISYSGYVHLPSKLLAPFENPSNPYDINTYFLYVPARHDPGRAPLSLWMGGGPGVSGLDGATDENGPCYVSKNANSTYLNEWSFNNHVNMLYIDVPNMTGYSYQSLTNGTLDILSGIQPGVEILNQTNFPGTFPVQDSQQTGNSSTTNAKILWEFMQGWLDLFPEHKTKDDRISLWSNSYGGLTGPSIVSYFLTQNEKINSKQISNARSLHLDTLGLTNSCIDSQIQYLSWPDYAYNNTYGLQMISDAVYKETVNNYTKPGGCRDAIDHCRRLGKKLDPEFLGNNEQVNSVCAEVVQTCLQVVYYPMVFANRSSFDVAHKVPDPEPPVYSSAYFNQRWVQEALGVPVNFTLNPELIVNNFIFKAGDIIRQDISPLKHVLDNGIKVALVYGDRDQRCNWIGGEQVSLKVPYKNSAKFQKAGYEPLTTNNTYKGGVVRQYGSLSFSRVYQAGHAAGYSQPETVYKIFMRAMFNKDIATGTKRVGSGSQYQSQGPSSTWHIKNKLPPSPPPQCQLYAAKSICTENQIAALQAGTAVIKDYIVVSPAS